MVQKKPMSKRVNLQQDQSFYDVPLTSRSVKFTKFCGYDLIIRIKSYQSENDNSFHFLVTLWSVSVDKNTIYKINCSVYLLIT